MKRNLAALCFLVSLIPAAFLAQSRPATEAEKAFGAKVLATVTKALPTPPAGWDASEKPSADAPDTVSGEGPMAITILAGWVDPKAAPKTAAGNPEEEALLAKQKELADALGKAAAKNDTAALEPIQKELDDIEAKLDNIEAKKATAPKTEPVSAADSKLSVRVEVNARLVPLPAGAKAIQPVAGFKAYRSEEDGGATLVFLGPFAEKKEGGATRMEAPAQTGAKVASVQTVAVRFGGSASRAKAAADKTNWTALKGLLGK